MLGFPVGVSKSRKTPRWLAEGVYVCEQLSVCVFGCHCYRLIV